MTGSREDLVPVLVALLVNDLGDVEVPCPACSAPMLEWVALRDDASAIGVVSANSTQYLDLGRARVLPGLKRRLDDAGLEIPTGATLTIKSLLVDPFCGHEAWERATEFSGNGYLRSTREEALRPATAREVSLARDHCRACKGTCVSTERVEDLLAHDPLSHDDPRWQAVRIHADKLELAGHRVGWYLACWLDGIPSRPSQFDEHGDEAELRVDYPHYHGHELRDLGRWDRPPRAVGACAPGRDAVRAAKMLWAFGAWSPRTILVPYCGVVMGVQPSRLPDLEAGAIVPCTFGGKTPTSGTVNLSHTGDLRMWAAGRGEWADV